MKLHNTGTPAPRYKIVAINENRDFRRIYARGKSSVSPILVTYVCKNKGKHLRVGITASKKIGNAVQRNRSRRVIRAAFRSFLPALDKQRNLDLIFVARGKTPFVKSTAVEKAMAQHLKEAGLIR
ncbi:MAG: ribonuclease P protein component [Oscillospiraceae bacterium]|nr:ribonuclease P protein component [Oscillospiraceae bacterium]